MSAFAKLYCSGNTSHTMSHAVLNRSITSIGNLPNSNVSSDDAYQKVQEVLDHTKTLALVLSITMVIALVGNLFLAVMLIKMSRRRMGPVQILIMHTCVADICFALCTALPQMASTLTFPYFYGGDFLCRLVKYLQLIPMFASPYLLVAISVDRYIAICRPLLALKWKYRLVHTLAAAAWIAALTLSTPNTFAFRYALVDNTVIAACMFQMDETFEKAWIGLFSLIVWLIPSIIVAVLYTRVCCAVWKSMHRPEKHRGSLPNVQMIREEAAKSAENWTGAGQRRESYGTEYEYTICSMTSGGVRKNFTPSINSYKVKTVKLTLTIVVANFVLWAPFCITNVISTYFRNIEIDVMVTTCIMLVGNANSCVNPWIYIVFNYKRVWEELCSANQGSNDRCRTSTPTSVVKPPTSASRRSALTAENSIHIQYDDAYRKISPAAYYGYVHGRCQNSQRHIRYQSRSNRSSVATIRRHSQTSTISSYSTV